jgi:beta-lactamase class A
MLRVLVAFLLLMLSEPGLAAAVPGASDMIEQRAAEAVEVLQARRKPEDVFNPQFLAAVPPEQLAALIKPLVAQNGKIVAAEDIRAEASNSATFRIRFERAIAVGRMTIETAPPFRISGFRITAVIPIADSAEKVRGDFAALPGRSGFSVARLDARAPAPLLSHNAGEQFAIGSVFKLWVLDALAEDIAAGRHRWNEVVRLGPRSLPGGITQDWPSQAPVTVETLATLMISISDNTATDTLIGLVGRERIAERIRATGHADPSRMLPLLTTAEAFALKLGTAERRAAYAKADDAGQARLLAGIDTVGELAAAKLSGLDGAPLAVDTVEWFASPGDVVRVLDSLRRRGDPRVLAILGVTPHLDASQREQFAYVGYKGGSESGVLTLTWLLRDKAGAWFAVTASWNDPEHALDAGKLEALGARLVMLTRQGS